jgi:hypothetical protein
MFAVLTLFALPAQAEDKQFTITVTEPQLNLIGAALGKMPFEQVAPTVQAIQAQINAQLKQQASPPPPLPTPVPVPPEQEK